MAVKSRDSAEWLRAESLPSDSEFWRAWLREAGPVLGAESAQIAQPQSGSRPHRVLLRWGGAKTIPPELLAGLSFECPLCRCESEGRHWFAIRLPWDEQTADHLMVAGELGDEFLNGSSEASWRDRALLWATATGRRRRARELETLKLRADELAAVIELESLIRLQQNFAGAALETCNQLAMRHQADRVALGWWREPYVKLSAMSQHNQIESRMTAAGEIEAAMEEAIEQDMALLWPVFMSSDDPDAEDAPPAVENKITVQHQALGKQQGWSGLCTVPLRNGGKVIGAVTWHRVAGAFTQDEVERFALSLDVLGPLLEDSERRSGSWFRRAKRAAEGFWEQHANLQHPWPKLGAITLALGLAAALLIHVPYRVEAEFHLRPRQQMVFSAPFDGFIKSLAVSPGDVVPASGELFSLEDTELRLEEGELLADLSRFNREREQSEATHDLALMRVAEARRDQVEARLARIHRKISQAVVRAPFAGTALDDGNLSERLGAPVRQGDALMRFAQLEGLYFELAVPEADGHLITLGGPVEIAFSGNPDMIIKAKVTRLEPEATSREAGAFFTVWAEPTGRQPEWWRPGMTGIGKMDTERRSLFDISQPQGELDIR